MAWLMVCKAKWCSCKPIPKPPATGNTYVVAFGAYFVMEFSNCVTAAPQSALLSFTPPMTSTRSTLLLFETRFHCFTNVLSPPTVKPLPDTAMFCTVSMPKFLQITSPMPCPACSAPE